jgi:hypothetical protein
MLADCVSTVSDGSIGQELERLSQLAQCERDSKAAVRAWYADLVARNNTDKK